MHKEVVYLLGLQQWCKDIVKNLKYVQVEITFAQEWKI